MGPFLLARRLGVTAWQRLCTVEPLVPDSRPEGPGLQAGAQGPAFVVGLQEKPSFSGQVVACVGGLLGAPTSLVPR